MPSYTPNVFASGAAPVAQAAQSQALRSYAPNKMSGMNQPQTQAMAPHLSVAAADRPYAGDIDLLRNSELSKYVPDQGSLDTMWRNSPHTYENQVSAMLRKDPGVPLFLDEMKRQKEAGPVQPFIRGISDGD